MNRQVLIVLSCALLIAVASSPWPWKWTDDAGRFSIEGELVKFQGEKVVLKRADGAAVTGRSEAGQQDVETHAGFSKTGVEQGAGGKTSSEQTEPRIYPSFPDAVSQPPEWIGPNAPFDVAEFLQAPPPEENAAPLYLDALFEFDSGLDICYSPRGEKPQGEIQQRADLARRRSREFYRLYEAWQKDPSSVEQAAADALLAEFETGLKKVAEAQKRPRCVFETGISFDSFLPHPVAARHAARVVEFRTWDDLARRDFERPIRGLEMVLRMSRDLRPRGVADVQLLSIAIDNICCEQSVPAILTTPGITVQHCDRLLTALAKHEAEGRDRFSEAFRADYVRQRKILHDLQYHTGSFGSERLKELGMQGNLDTPFACFQYLCAADVTGRFDRDVYGEHAIPRTPAEVPSLRLVRGWAVDGKLLSEADYAKQVDALNRVWQSILNMADQTPLERLHEYAEPTLLAPLRKTTLAMFLEPPADSILHQLPRADAILRGTKCLIALRRWQLEHDGRPPDLATVIKAAGMREVPVDPYSDQPMRMTTLDGQTVIYAVGLDGKDDRGRLQWDYGAKKPQGDIVFRLQAPQ